MRRKSSFKTILYLAIVAILGAMFSTQIKSAVEKLPVLGGQCQEKRKKKRNGVLRTAILILLSS